MLDSTHLELNNTEFDLHFKVRIFLCGQSETLAPSERSEKMPKYRPD